MGQRVELEGYDSFAEIRMDQDRVMCSDGEFMNLPQGLFLRGVEYYFKDECRALSDTRGRIKRINYRINAKNPANDNNWIATMGLLFGVGKGWNVFETSDSTEKTIKDLGSVLVGTMKVIKGCCLTHQIDISYPQPLKTRPDAFRFRSIVSHHGRMLYNQDITIQNF